MKSQHTCLPAVGAVLTQGRSSAGSAEEGRYTLPLEVGGGAGGSLPGGGCGRERPLSAEAPARSRLGQAGAAWRLHGDPRNRSVVAFLAHCVSGENSGVRRSQRVSENSN